MICVAVRARRQVPWLQPWPRKKKSLGFFSGCLGTWATQLLVLGIFCSLASLARTRPPPQPSILLCRAFRCLPPAFSTPDPGSRIMPLPGTTGHVQADSALTFLASVSDSVVRVRGCDRDLPNLPAPAWSFLACGMRAAGHPLQRIATQRGHGELACQRRSVASAGPAVQCSEAAARPCPHEGSGAVVGYDDWM